MFYLEFSIESFMSKNKIEGAQIRNDKHHILDFKVALFNVFHIAETCSIGHFGHFGHLLILSANIL